LTSHIGGSIIYVMSSRLKVLSIKFLLIAGRGLRALRHPAKFALRLSRKPAHIFWKIVFRIVILPLYRIYIKFRLEIRSGGEGLRTIFTNRSSLHIFVTTIVIVVVFDLFLMRTFAAPDLSSQSKILSFFDEEDGDEAEVLVEEKDLVGSEGLGYVPMGFSDLNEDDEEIFALIAGGGAFLRPLGPTPSEGILTRLGIETYIVEPGDTVSRVATRFGISINTVLWANNLSARSVLRAGQELVILPVSGVMHRVKRGDTLDAVASRYKGSTERIIAFNNLASRALQAGQTVIIPDGRIPPPPPPPPRLRGPTFVPTAIVGKLFWPVGSKRLTQYFWWRHPGIDIGTPAGTPIYAADDGIVEFTKLGRTGYGFQIMIDHGNGMRTRYAHNSKILVSAGDQIKKGDVIAYSGNTGRSTGPHLHFEIFIGSRRVNPLQYIR